LKAETLFISDLHLRYSRPAITRRFLGFIQHRASNVERLFILGDLFDAWVGDDDWSPPNNQVKTALKTLTSQNTNVYLQLGNRDFLIGNQFIKETGVTLLDDYSIIDLYGQPTLLMHGDLLCSDDLAYLEFRKKTRTASWRHEVLSKPLLLRLAYARWYRFRSHFHKRKKSQEIMDVNQNTVVETLRKYQVTRLIHGHTHRPNIHNIDVDNNPAQRIVLDQWEHRGNILVWNDNGSHIEYFD